MWVYLDESGNLGQKDRYFVIASVAVDNPKPLKNLMKKLDLKTRTAFPEFQNSKEIKASDAYPSIKEFYLRKMVSQDIEIRYIVVDKNHLDPRLIARKNVCYNYLLQFLIDPLARKQRNGSLSIILDNRNTAVGSLNSFEEYIYIKVNAEWSCNVDLSIKYVESHTLYNIQAADFIANAIWPRYEYTNQDFFYKILEPKIIYRELFPKYKFGR